MAVIQSLTVDRRIRLGIVGCGGICRGSHVPVYQNEKRVEVVAVCDLLPERTAAIRAFFPAATAYADYRDLLARPEIDAIDICTPNDLHSEVAIAAFQAGKHVICEKPDAVDPDKAQAMKAASEAAGRCLMVMRNNRFVDASQYANFVDVLYGLAEPCFLPQQGVDMIRILTAIYESARSGAEVRL